MRTKIPHRLKECKRCGKGGLHWEEDNGRYVLVSRSGEIQMPDGVRG